MNFLVHGMKIIIRIRKVILRDKFIHQVFITLIIEDAFPSTYGMNILIRIRKVILRNKCIHQVFVTIRECIS
jgi:hypothetical protein